jgi:hypothetical protein
VATAARLLSQLFLELNRVTRHLPLEPVVLEEQLRLAEPAVLVETVEQ